MAGELPVELHQAAKAAEAFRVLGAAACFEHAGEIDERGNVGADAATEVVAVAADADVVVAARSPRGGDHGEAAGPRFGAQRLAGDEVVRANGSAFGGAGVELFQRARESA